MYLDIKGCILPWGVLNGERVAAAVARAAKVEGLDAISCLLNASTGNVALGLCVCRLRIVGRCLQAPIHSDWQPMLLVCPAEDPAQPDLQRLKIYWGCTQPSAAS